LGLLPAVKYLAEGFQKRTGIKVKIDTQVTSEKRFHQAIETALYRATQEALSNIARHAHADNVEVRIWTDNQVVYCSILDNGIGFKNSTHTASGTAAGGLGLLGIQERINSLHGGFTVNSAAGPGAELLISIPIRE
ncbi:MAG: sensor histidine kinase, partial [Gammaproteobacteria bacterium]